MEKGRNLKKFVTIITLTVSFLLIISSNFGIVKADDCLPACLFPDALGDTTTETMVGDLQEALDTYPYYDLSGIDVTDNQTQYQRWDYDEDVDVVSIEFEYIGHDAGNQNVMGYYFDSDVNSFVGVFEIPDNWGNDHSGYDLPIASVGDRFTVNNIPKSELGRIGFAIDSENGETYKLFSENDLNPNDKDRALVFTLCDDEYGLIYVICFEDLKNDAHKDFYDACAILRIIECDPCIDAIDDEYDVNEGESLNIVAPGVLDNDINNCGDGLSVELISGPNFDLSFTLNTD